MKTKLTSKRDFEKAVRAAGGTLEVDWNGSDLRVFQAVAPRGKRWAGEDLVCLKVDFYPGYMNDKFNAESLEDLKQRMSHGLEDIPADEMELYAED